MSEGPVHDHIHYLFVGIMNVTLNIDSRYSVTAYYVGCTNDQSDQYERSDSRDYENTLMILKISHLSIPDRDTPLNAEYQPHFKQQRNNRGSSVTDERERYSRIGYGICHDSYIQNDLNCYVGHESHYQ